MAGGDGAEEGFREFQLKQFASYFRAQRLNEV